MAYGNIQEVNVNHVSGYPMISPESNNKEVMKKENMTSYEIYGYNGIISIIIHMTSNILFTRVNNYDHSALCNYVHSIHLVMRSYQMSINFATMLSYKQYKTHHVPYDMIYIYIYIYIYIITLNQSYTDL